MSELIDKNLVCRDCKQTFVFSSAEQEFFRDKGLTNEPKRCANCRLLLRSQKLGIAAEQTTTVECNSCNQPTRVPFQPNGHKPVLCNVCFHNKKMAALPAADPAPRELALAN